jgi:RNA polymerase sigma-70 factor (ECF subfamily)
MPEVPAVRSRLLDPESREWLASLRSVGAEQAAAIERLHDLLLRAARFEVARRRPGLPHLRGNELDDIAQEAADDALMSVLGRLDDFRGASRFTTWVYKFALYEAAVKLRRRFGRAARSRAGAGDGACSPRAAPLRGRGPAGRAAREVRTGSPKHHTRQREVLVALALNGVPIDVPRAPMGSTRGALYKTLHDAR